MIVRASSTGEETSLEEVTMPLPPKDQRQNLLQAIRKAREINRMLQGTMGLEGQGLDARLLRELKRETTLELLGRAATA